MTTFLLIRHGETDAIGKVIMGWRPGWHLNEKGRRQAKALSRRLERVPLRAMYTSPLERAVETAAIVGESHAIVPQPDSAIGEVRFGDWEGLTMQELESFDLWRRYNQFRSGTRPPGGETMLEVQGRMVRRLEELSAAHGDTCIGLVSHGDPLRATLAYYLGVPLDLLLRFEVAPASLSVLELAEWGARVQCLNQTEAL